MRSHLSGKILIILYPIERKTSIGRKNLLQLFSQKLLTKIEFNGIILTSCVT